MRFLRNHSFTLVVGALVVLAAWVSAWTTHTYWVVEGPEAHGPFWNYWAMSILHEYHGELLIGVLAVAWFTKELREKGSPETGDD